MTMEKIFEQATRMKVRFNHKGVCSAEDLWDMPLSALDAIFKALNQEAKAQSEESLLAVKTATSAELDLKLAIVKHVVKTRLEEKVVYEQAKANADRKNTILGIIAEKQNESLKSMSIDELKKLVAE
jgi:hypothetical protein